MSEEDHRISKKLICVYLVLVLVIWAASWFFTMKYFGDWQDRANFGDMFGAVNSLFAGLAFAGIIITVYMQSKELALQRDELKLTRDELRGQKEQLITQNETLRRQRFENTFFQLLRNHQDIVNGIDIRSYDSATKQNHVIDVGRDCFKFFYKEQYKLRDVVD
jgi:hypothetical protein